MPGFVSLADLVTRVRRRSSHENSLFVSDAEVEEYVEQSLGALYDLVIESNGPAFWQDTSAPTKTVPGEFLYLPGDDPPIDIYKIIAVEVLWDGKYRKVRPYTAADDMMLEDETGWTHHSGIRYRALYPKVPSGPIVGSALGGAGYRHIRFIPTPQAEHTFRVRYIPVPADWSTNPTYSFTGLSGWDEWIVCDAAAKVLEKEESLEQAQYLIARREAAADRIRWATSTMNEDGQGRVRDLDEEALAWWPRRAFV